MGIKWFDDIKSFDKENGTMRVSEKAIRQVEKIMETTLARHIDEAVYQRYSPTVGGWVNGSTYERRYDLPSSIVVERDGDELVAYTTAFPSDPVVKGWVVDGDNGGFLRLLENDEGGFGIWKKGFRRFPVRNAQIDLDFNPIIPIILQHGVEES